MIENKHTRSNFPRTKQRGFSIVELMVAILIGLIIMAGVVQVVVSSKTTFLSQEDMAYIQENARYAIDTISRDIQNSGYWGCAGANPLYAMVASYDDDDANAQALMGTLPSPSHSMEPMQAVGYDDDFPDIDDDDVWTPQRTAASPDSHDPESIIIRRAEGDVYSIQSHSGSTFNLSSSVADIYNADDYIAVVAGDCRRVGVVRLASVSGSQMSYDNTSVCSSAVKPNIQGQSYDCTSLSGSPLVESYSPGSVAMKYLANGYFIAESSVLDDQPALKRMHMNGDSTKVQEIALGVEDMAFTYGFRSGDNVQYYSADSLPTNQWHNLVAVKIDLVMRSQTPSANKAESNELLGNTYDDRYIRRLISTTVQLKNRT